MGNTAVTHSKSEYAIVQYTGFGCTIPKTTQATLLFNKSNRFTSVQDKCCMTAALLPELVHMGVDGHCLNKAKDQCNQAHIV